MKNVNKQIIFLASKQLQEAMDRALKFYPDEFRTQSILIRLAIIEYLKNKKIYLNEELEE